MKSLGTEILNALNLNTVVTLFLQVLNNAQSRERRHNWHAKALAPMIARIKMNGHYNYSAHHKRFRWESKNGTRSKLTISLADQAAEPSASSQRTLDWEWVLNEMGSVQAKQEKRHPRNAARGGGKLFLFVVFGRFALNRRENTPQEKAQKPDKNCVSDRCWKLSQRILHLALGKVEWIYNTLPLPSQFAWDCEFPSGELLCV